MSIDWSSLKISAPRPDKGAPPNGTVIYTGFQGSGKTMSLVRDAYLYRCKFPTIPIFSNVGLNSSFPATGPLYRFSSANELTLILKTHPESKLLLMDEAHLYFREKSGVPYDVVSSISQQRKQRTRFLMTSQLWNQMDLNLRQQPSLWIECRKSHYLHWIVNFVKDGQTLAYDKARGKYTAVLLRKVSFKPNLFYCSLYDTLQRVVTNDQLVEWTPQPMEQPDVVVNLATKKHSRKH